MKLNKLTFTAMAVVAIIAQPLYAAIAGHTASALSGNTTVKPVSMDGWVISGNSGGAVNFVSTSSTKGSSALRLTTTSANESDVRITKTGLNISVADLAELSYDSKVITASAAGNTAFRLGIDLDNNGTEDVPLVYEPYYNFTAHNPSSVNASNSGDWQTWNVKDGKFWGAWNSGGAYATNKTLAEVVAGNPDAKIVRMSLGLGSYNPSWETLADNIKVNGYYIDFERATIAQCLATNNVHSTSLTSWDMSESRATGHNEITADGLHIWTESNTTTDKAAGYYVTDFALQNLGTNTIAGMMEYTTNAGAIAPGLQLVVDFNNDGTPDGTLVGEPVYGNNWWLTGGSAQFAKDGAPQTGGGNGSPYFGTAEEWLNAFPSARVKAIGYSLGSGVYGYYTITKITAGCVEYTFGLPVVEPETPTPETPSGDNGGNTTTSDNNGEVPAVGGSGAASSSSDSDVAVAESTTTTNESKDAEVLGTDESDVDTSSAQDTKEEKHWSLVNVLLAGVAVVMSIITLAGIRGSEGRAKWLRILTIIPAVGAIIAVLTVEDFTATLGWVNGWTLLFVAIAIAQTILMTSVKPADN